MECKRNSNVISQECYVIYNPDVFPILEGPRFVYWIYFWYKKDIIYGLVRDPISVVFNFISSFMKILHICADLSYIFHMPFLISIFVKSLKKKRTYYLTKFFRNAFASLTSCPLYNLSEEPAIKLACKPVCPRRGVGIFFFLLSSQIKAI